MFSCTQKQTQTQTRHKYRHLKDTNTDKYRYKYRHLKDTNTDKYRYKYRHRQDTNTNIIFFFGYHSRFVFIFQQTRYKFRQIYLSAQGAICHTHTHAHAHTQTNAPVCILNTI